MNEVQKIWYYLLHRPASLGVAILIRLAPLFPDKLYLKLMFRLKMGYWMDFSNPQTFSEKLQWLKLYNRKPEYTKMVDKYEVKKYVAEIIGEEYIIPTLGVWNSVDDIDFEALPEKFVLKTTHGGGSCGVIVCRDKSQLDIITCKNKLVRSLKQSIYKISREWPYKNVKPRIIAEQYIEDEIYKDLPDYKFYCFDGQPLYCQVIRDRSTNETIDFYDLKWNHMPFIGLNPVASNGLDPVAKPRFLDNIIVACEKLSAGIPFSRIDMYVVRDKIYFGEITFYPASGMGTFSPEEWNYTLGSWIKL